MRTVSCVLCEKTKNMIDNARTPNDHDTEVYNAVSWYWILLTVATHPAICTFAGNAGVALMYTMAVSRDGSAAEMLASNKARSESAGTDHCNVNLPFHQKLEIAVAV